MARIPTATVNLAAQAVAIKARFPSADLRIRHQTLHGRLELQPTPASRAYTVNLFYRPPDRPRVTVLNPQLELRFGATRLPHVYPGDELCLYYRDEWKLTDLIATSIVPWACEWLQFYELWHATGFWLGGGIEHSTT